MNEEKPKSILGKEAMYLPENIAHVREIFAERLEDRATDPDISVENKEIYELAQKVREGSLIPFSRRVEEIYLGLSYDGTVENYVDDYEMNSINYRKLFFIDFIGLGDHGYAKDGRSSI